MPPVSNVPTSILAAWTALEVLSPPSFRRPEDLAGGDRSAVASWIIELAACHGSVAARAAAEHAALYQVVLGTIDLEAAFARLISVFGDARISDLPLVEERSWRSSLSIGRAENR